MDSGLLFFLVSLLGAVQIVKFQPGIINLLKIEVFWVNIFISII